MRKRALLIFLCIALTLSLAACGNKETGKDPKPSDEPTSGQTASKPSEPEGDTTEPSGDTTEPTTEPPTEPVTEPTEPATEPPVEDPQVQAAADFLELLKAEYNSDTAVGMTAKHVYSTWSNFSVADHFVYSMIFTGEDTVYFHRDDYETKKWYSYNIQTKELTELTDLFPDNSSLGNGSRHPQGHYSFYLDGCFYIIDSTSNRSTVLKTDMSGNKVPFSPYGDNAFDLRYYGGGFCCIPGDSQGETKLYSLDLEQFATVPAPQKELAHGLTEPYRLSGGYSVGGKIFRTGFSESDPNTYLFCLDPAAATPEWTTLGNVSDQPELIRFYADNSNFAKIFVGKYYCGLEYPFVGSVYDLSTGEAVFEFGDLYAPAVGTGTIYFGGDRYIGYSNSTREYRWVDLSTCTMSDPLKLPDYPSNLCFLNETYCIYTDQYGVFLWNYETGEETTIFMDKT